MDFLKKHIVSLVLWAITGIGLLVWGYIQKGAKLEFKEQVESVIEDKIESRDFMTKVMTSKFMVEYKTTEKLKTINTILTTRDSGNVDYFEILSARSGLTKEALLDSLVLRIKDGGIDDNHCIQNIRKFNRRLATF